MKKSSSQHTRRASSPSDRNSTRLQIAPSSQLVLSENSAPAPADGLRRVRFGYFNPEAREVHVVGSFNGWDPRVTPMARDALGDWSVTVELPTGEHRYRLFVDGRWCDDPSAQQTASNPFGGFDAVMVVV